MTSKLAISIYLKRFRLTRKLENFGCLEMSKQFIVSIILLNVAVAAIAVRLAVITALVVIIAAINHAQYFEKRDHPIKSRHMGLSGFY